jgi:lysophospholipase L1-like esterase
MPSLSLVDLIIQSLSSFTTSIEQMVLLSNLVIASLGSSYASGPGIAPQLDPTDAARSGNNFAHLLTQKLTGSILTDLSVSGATLSNILDVSQTNGATTFAPQINGLPEDADLILVLGGGNDVNYVGSLQADSNTTVNVTSLSAKYGKVLDALHAKAANAHIIAVTYLTVLGADVVPKGEDGANVVFNASRAAYHQNTAEKVRQATLMAIMGRQDWAEVLDVVDPSWTHGLGSSAPWVNGSKTTPEYHPRAEGHVAVADMLYERLQGESEKKTRRSRRK